MVMTIRESAASGDRLSALCDLRDVLAAAIAGCESGRDLAALTGRFQSVLAEIAELMPEEPKGDVVDQIAERRAARRSSTTSGSGRAKRSG